jgi:hypothetical protein
MLFLVDKTVSDEVTCELVTTNVVTSNIPTLAEFRTLILDATPRGRKKKFAKKKKKVAIRYYSLAV